MSFVAKNKPRQSVRASSPSLTIWRNVLILFLGGKRRHTALSGARALKWILDWQNNRYGALAAESECRAADTER